MKKEYVSPVARIIELQMNENIASSIWTPQESKIMGSWEFTVEVDGRCFENVTGTWPSLYNGMGITTPTEMAEKGFSSTGYAFLVLEPKYGDEVMTIWGTCGRG